MTAEQKHDFWKRHIESWRHSQLTQQAYCTQHNISFANFGYWRTRLKRKPESGSKLIPVRLANSSTSISIFLPAGIRLEVPAHVLADVLPLVCRAVQERN